jgi:hypothetical protein
MVEHGRRNASQIEAEFEIVQSKALRSYGRQLDQEGCGRNSLRGITGNIRPVSGNDQVGNREGPAAPSGAEAGRWPSIVLVCLVSTRHSMMA